MHLPGVNKQSSIMLHPARQVPDRRTQGQPNTTSSRKAHRERGSPSPHEEAKPRTNHSKDTKIKWQFHKIASMAMDVMYNNSKRYQYDRTRCDPITQTETPLSHEHTTEETPAKTNIETQNKTL